MKTHTVITTDGSKRVFKRPDYNKSLSAQPKYIFFDSDGEYKIFIERYKDVLNHISHTSHKNNDGIRTMCL